MMTYDIPDPFITTKTKQYGTAKGFEYDYFAQEWVIVCTTCGVDLYAPNKYDMLKTHTFHTRNECLGGY